MRGVQQTECICVSGWGMPNEVWHWLSTYWPADWVLRAIDLYAAVDVLPDMPLSLSMLAESISCALDQQGGCVAGRRRIWWAWSMGGLAVIEWLSQADPQWVGADDALVLVASSPYFGCDQNWDFGLAQSAHIRFEQQYQRSPERALKQFCRLYLPGVNFDAPGLGWHQLMPLHQGIKAQWSQAYLRLLREADVRQTVTQLNMPVYMVLGEQDRLLPFSAHPSVLRECANVVVEGIQQAGHGILLTHPEQLWVKLSSKLVSV